MESLNPYETPNITEEPEELDNEWHFELVVIALLQPFVMMPIILIATALLCRAFCRSQHRIVLFLISAVLFYLTLVTSFIVCTIIMELVI